MEVVYTAMHGVGTPFVKRMLDAFGFKGQLICVEEQCTPDPAFPTVKFPNPEEEGALVLAMKTADNAGASLIVANDPDADRFAAAEKCEGKWYTFSGDELGVLLGAYAMRLREQQGISKNRMAFITSAVSSRMLQKMARTNDCRFAETLTGFKWMEAKALELEAAGFFPVLLYEEALGYALSSCVRDKDGISAVAVFLQCAAELHAEGKQLKDMLLELNRAYGCFSTQNSYFTCSSSDSCRRFFTAITHAAESQAAVGMERRGGDDDRGGGGKERAEAQERGKNTRTYPKQIGRFHVVRVRDVARGYDSQEDNFCCSLPQAHEMLSFFFDNGAVLTLRGSGTEPKLKYYAEACASTPQHGRQILQELVEAFIAEYVNPRADLFIDVPQ